MKQELCKSLTSAQYGAHWYKVSVVGKKLFDTIEVSALWSVRSWANYYFPTLYFLWVPGVEAWATCCRVRVIYLVLPLLCHCLGVNSKPVTPGTLEGASPCMGVKI